MEFVEAGEREQFFACRVVGHTDWALDLAIIIALDIELGCVFRFARSWQLRKNVGADWILVIS